MQRCASEQQIHKWFDTGMSAYGIVCGSISNNIVIDIDNIEIQAEFMWRFPDLLNTYLVISGLRKTLHIYFEVDFPVKSQKLRGGDLKAEGGYVVGAASCIAGGTWEICKNKPLYKISEAELNKVLVDFGNGQEFHSPISQLPQGAKSPDDFLNLYRFLVNELGQRNEALFRVGCQMRDAGYCLSDTIEILAMPHAKQATNSKHKPERYEQRQAEAETTLHSVFSKPPRMNKEASPFNKEASYLPNALREAILEYRDGPAFLRVFEGLRLLGKQAGDTVSCLFPKQS
jgi:hypothetical protein